MSLAGAVPVFQECYDSAGRSAHARGQMDVLMPQLGETVAEGKITQWYKAPGDAVQPGDNLFEIETDKISMEVPATAAGVLAENPRPGSASWCPWARWWPSSPTGKAPQRALSPARPGPQAPHRSARRPPSPRHPRPGPPPARHPPPTAPPARSSSTRSSRSAPRSATTVRRGAAASPSRRWPAGWRRRAASTLMPSAAQARTGASSRATSPRRRNGRAPRRPRASRRSRSCDR